MATLGDEPIFPIDKYDPETGKESIDRGLTKREVFAAAAMQGLLSANMAGITSEDKTKLVAQVSVRCGDALLAELAKEKADG